MGAGCSPAAEAWFGPSARAYPRFWHVSFTACPPHKASPSGTQGTADQRSTAASSASSMAQQAAAAAATPRADVGAGSSCSAGGRAGSARRLLLSAWLAGGALRVALRGLQTRTLGRLHESHASLGPVLFFLKPPAPLTCQSSRHSELAPVNAMSAWSAACHSGVPR